MGLQTNSAALGWQQLHGLDYNFHSYPDNIDRVDGTGIGTYLGIFGEYLSESWWGFQFRISHDVRNALVIDDTRLPIPSFDTKLSYLTFEPLFRADQKLIPNLNFYAGPFLALNLGATFIFKYNKDEAPQEPETDVIAINKLTYGVQGGIAYDIKFADLNQNSSLYASPFIEASWMINQKGESLPDQNAISDVWSTGSYRLGVRLSMENRDPIDGINKITKSEIPEYNKVFVVMPDDNKILTKNVKGYFPIHPYVFFEKGNVEIPPRYIILSKADAKNFNEEELGNFIKGDLTTKETNVDQLMIAYYNNMNIFGDRMSRNTGEKLILRTSDPDELNAEVQAVKIKSYLVDAFGIDPDRISIEIAPPRKVSGSDSTESVSRTLINDENRRVEFVFTNPNMTKPIAYTIRDESSIDNDMIFSISGDEPFRSWDITISGEDRSLYFGPYSYSYARINPAELMRFLETGRYNAKVTITDKKGNKTEQNVAFKLTKEKELKNAARYLMLFDYNSADAIKTYETKIKNEIVPGIERGNKVIVHGHTDVIGTEAGNLKLSQERADQAKAIIDSELSKENRIVTVKSIGIGQTKNQYTFNNRYPEGRLYNRNIFVEVLK